jgi:hypothetical protein
VRDGPNIATRFEFGRNLLDLRKHAVGQDGKNLVDGTTSRAQSLPDRVLRLSYCSWYVRRSRRPRGQ